MAGKRRKQNRNIMNLTILSQFKILKVTTEYRISYLFTSILFFPLVHEKEFSNSFLVSKLEGNELVQRVTSLHNELC